MFTKPACPYSVLIALALKSSPAGSMSVSEIYEFFREHYPYFRTAPSGWKNSVRHNLSIIRYGYFIKIKDPLVPSSKNGGLWKINPAKANKLEEVVNKWKDPLAIKKETHEFSDPQVP